MRSIGAGRGHAVTLRVMLAVLGLAACTTSELPDEVPARAIDVASAVDLDEDRVTVRAIVGESRAPGTSQLVLCDGGEDSLPISCLGAELEIDGVSDAILTDLARRPREVTITGIVANGVIIVESIHGGLDCPDCPPVPDD